MNPVTPWLHDRPVRNNNPGDLRPRGEAPEWPGQDELDTGAGGPFAIFVTSADGWAALGLWALDARYLRGLRTAGQLIDVFAPPSQNNTAEYRAGVEARMGAGELDLSDTATLEALCKTITHWEDSRAVWSDALVAGGMTLCTARWPAYRAARLQAAPDPAAPDPSPTTDALNEAELRSIDEQPT